MAAPNIELFDREAARYDAWFDTDRGRALFRSEIACLQAVTQGLPLPWVEVGVGTGRFAEALGIDVGIDPAAGALEYARRRGVHVARGTGEDLPFENGSFGGVFVIVTICFADDPAALLREAARIAGEDGGVVLGIVPAGSPWGRLYSQKGRSGHTFYSRARFYDPDELDRIAQDAGLELEQHVSTLFQRPGVEPLEVEVPYEGRHEGAGFVALLYRNKAASDYRYDFEQLVCSEDSDDSRNTQPATFEGL